MYVSYRWLKSLIDFDTPADQLVGQLTGLGLEVVGVRKVNVMPSGLVIGEVVAKRKHPNADKLNLVDIRHLTSEGKEETVEVVCGASNIDQNQKIVFAPIGTDLGGWVIKKAKIRGIFSHGMVLSRAEAQKEEKSEGIWVLPDDVTLQDDLKKIWGEEDFIYDIDITSNRVDCHSMVGIAHDLAAFYKKPLNQLAWDKQDAPKDERLGHFAFGDCHPLEPYKERDFFSLQSGAKNVKGAKGSEKLSIDDKLTVSVEVRDEETPCYLARRIRGIKVEPSPLWLQELLFFYGLRAINNVVDTTNWMMLCYGQPMHAFDFARLQGGLVVRFAKDKEKFVDLRGVKNECSSNDLVIADSKEVVALAGVVGGADSGVVDSTTEIVFEAAVFPPKSVRNTSSHHEISTDSARFFERSVASKRTAFVMDQATNFLINLKAASGALTSDVAIGPIVGKRPQIEKPENILLQYAQLEKILQHRFDGKEVADILSALKCAVVSNSAEKIEITPPFFRKDLVYEWDLIEEVARIYGYEKIKKNRPAVRHRDHHLLHYPERDAKSIPLSLGYDEVISFPIVKQDFLQKIYEKNHGENWKKHCGVAVVNPMHVDYRHLRKDMLYGLLKTLKVNIDHHAIDKAHFFECGHVFDNHVSSDQHSGGDAPSSDGYSERVSIGFLLAQKISNEKNQNATHYNDHLFFHLKGDMIAFAKRFGAAVENFSFAADELSYSHSFAAASVRASNQNVGRLALVRDDLLDFFGLFGWKIFYGDFDLDAPIFRRKKKVQFQKSSSFPSVMRDLALVVNQEQSLGNLLESIKKSSPLIEDVVLSEVYSGKGIDQRKKSFVFRLKLRSKKETLSNEGADKIVLNVVEVLKKDYKFELR